MRWARSAGSRGAGGGAGDAGGRGRQRRCARLAAAALLFEVVRADAEVKDEERTVMRTAIQSTFGLAEDDAQELMRLAEEESRAAASLFQFTALVDQGFSAEEKKRLVELLWMVSFADTVKAAEEEHIVRKIAGLLHVRIPTSSTPSAGREPSSARGAEKRKSRRRRISESGLEARQQVEGEVRVLARAGRAASRSRPAGPRSRTG